MICTIKSIVPHLHIKLESERIGGGGAARRLIDPTTSILLAPAIAYAHFLLLEQHFSMQ